jgi:hypothetical protein
MFKEILGEAFPVIEKAAPVLATILGSPVSGIVANVALKAVAKKFDIEDLSSDALPKAITNDPEAESKLSQVEKYAIEFFKKNNIPVPSHLEVNLNIKADFNKVDSQT